jgi:hypothetical protein
LAAQLHFDAQVAMDVMEVGQIVQRLEQRVGFADLLAQLLSPSAGSFDLRASEASEDLSKMLARRRRRELTSVEHRSLGEILGGR